MCARNWPQRFSSRDLYRVKPSGLVLIRFLAYFIVDFATHFSSYFMWSHSNSFLYVLLPHIYNCQYLDLFMLALNQDPGP